MITQRLKILVAVAIFHPAPCYALAPERESAADLVRLGLLYDVGNKYPGCFILSPEGERMLFLMDLQLDGPSRDLPPL